jgi:hypothetical protein
MAAAGKSRKKSSKTTEQVSSASSPKPTSIPATTVVVEPVLPEKSSDGKPSGTRMSPLMVEHKKLVSRQNLLDIWIVLDWLAVNRKLQVIQALERHGIPEQRFWEALRNLGTETELWDAEMSPAKAGTYDDGEEDVEEAL